MFSLFPQSNFPNSTTATIFSIIFLIVILFELKLFTKLFLKISKSQDKNSLLFILLGAFTPITLMLFPFYKTPQLNQYLIYLGILVLITGFTIRQIAIKTLNKFFIPVVGIQKSQKIIKNGVYKFIRHPSYTGLLLELIGGSAALSNFPALIATILISLPSIIYRIKIEEKFLAENLKGYEKYQKESWKLIPYLY